MKKVLTTYLLFLSILCIGQTDNNSNFNKGKFYFNWGWNRSAYSTSDITFSGTDYNFTLADVKADDRQSPFSYYTYLNLKNITIPQYNFSLGYYFNEQWDISFSIDHMKYVMRQDQVTKISGRIDSSASAKYQGIYSNDEITLSPDFLTFEHTDGLNYINTAIHHSDLIWQNPKFRLSIKEGAGFGLLYPRTNTQLLGKQRYDEFHVAGYGMDASLALNLTFLNYVFIQTELKGGYIDLPDVRTTMSALDHAHHSFYFSQLNFTLGGKIKIRS